MNKVVWITGASSGIGAALTRQLSAAGNRLILTARRADKLQELLTTHVQLLPADLYAADTLEALTLQAISLYGHIDIVIHAAGVGQRSMAIETPMQVYRQLMEINYFAPVAITRYLLPHFQQQGSGHIVVIGSMAGLMGMPGRTGYSAAKHAVKGYFESLQAEGFDVTIVSPGRIRTDLSLHALTATGAPHNKMDAGQLKGIPVETCAAQIIHAIQHKKKHLKIARKEKLLYLLRIICSPLYYTIARQQAK